MPKSSVVLLFIFVSVSSALPHSPLASALASDFANSSGTDEAIDVIRATFEERESIDPELNQTDTPKCRLGATEKCPMSKMPRHVSNLIVPGGASRCIYASSTEYQFQVIPGDTDKLLFYFQGGGACWDALSSTLGACSSEAVPNDLLGLFDRQNKGNPYKDYTVVHVLYCSGDAHTGNVARNWVQLFKGKVEQRGFENTRSAVEWAKQNIDSKLSSLVISGCSAGSLGAQAWAAPLLREFKYEHAAVVVDSYAGIFPESGHGRVMKEFGICTRALLNKKLIKKCEAGKVEIQDIFETAIRENPSTAFAHVNSKTDSTQMSFYDGVAATFPSKTDPAILSGAEYLKRMNKVFGRYNANPNYVSFVVNGNQHCFTPDTITYTSDTTGINGKGKGGRITLNQWISEFPVQHGQSVQSECEGKALTQKMWKGIAYCDQAQVGKTFKP